MTTHGKDAPPVPLKTLKDTGYAGSKKSEAAPTQSEGERSLRALDNMLTASMRRDGLLPPPNDPPPVPATPPPNIADYDPLQMPVWTLLMALAWISSRDVERVTWQRDDWRRANGLPEGSVPTVSIGAGEGIDGAEVGGSDPTAFKALEAFAQLLAAGQEGRIEVQAMSDRGEPDTLRPIDWTYGKLSFDHQYDEIWRVGRQHFHTLTVQRDNLLKAFPPKLAIPVLAPGADEPFDPQSHDDGPQGLGPTVQILADAIWSKWRGIPAGFPRNDDRYGAIWTEAKNRQPALTNDKRPSADSFQRAEKAIKDHLAKRP